MRVPIGDIRRYRNLPFLKIGMRIDMNGKRGVITGGNSYGNLQVGFDGDSYSSNVHPIWMMTYYASDENIVADYKTIKVVEHAK